ncbi:MAG: hypothetical protein ABEH90_06170, partial [Halolamina sp.]
EGALGAAEFERDWERVDVVGDLHTRGWFPGMVELTPVAVVTAVARRAKRIDDYTLERAFSALTDG